ncbi:MAG: hypothetical protein LBD20_01890 [Spirochaetaceae bacterium]|jgi:hypothetical protein|nr:hypothetical protein [Spirochaetaceae bacterium]
MSNLEKDGFFLPAEYTERANALFPDKGHVQENAPQNRSFVEFAELLGIGADYRRIVAMQDDDLDFIKFVASFYKNLELLIDKTWVEKSDEMRKVMLHAQLPVFFSDMENRNYEKALDAFGNVLGELAFLLFGEQSEKKDFIENTFRIDSQMGLFWWYAGTLRKLKFHWNQEFQRALLLIGLCFLSNF